jgi:hypothetical protein
MNRDVRTAALALGLAAAAQGVGAIGFGRLPETATLGQPLELAIPLRLEAGEVLRSNCLSAEVFFADTPQAPGAVSLSLDPALPDAERRTLRLSTVNRVDEPFVTVEVSIGCAGRVSRRFTLFADPPSLRAPIDLATTGGAPTNDPAPADRTPVAANVAIPSADAPPVRPRPRADQPRRKPPARATATVPAAQAAAPAAQAAGGSRLRLDPPITEAQLAALAAADAAEQRASAAEAAALAASAAQAAAQSRAAQLEAANAALRAQAASAEQALAALRTRLQSERGPVAQGTFVPALLVLIALLLAGLVWLWHQRNQEREANAWLLHEAGADDLGPDEQDMPIVTTEPAAGRPAAPIAKGAARPASPPTLPWTGSEPAPLTTSARVAEHKREVSVEELIDLEQQAEFFVVLGQDEAAIDLLMGHLRSTAGNSPLPYLKLLEIYKRRGERNEYERLRERFNSRFSAVAPDWEANLQDGRSLEDYPSVTGRLEDLWSRPQRAMEVLQTTLLRADDERGARDGFDLPAYRELMLLYAVARDRSELEAGGTVDLLLPIGEEGDDHGGAASAGMFERLIATTSLEAQPAVFRPLEVDLPLDEPEPTKPAAMHFPRPRDLPEDVAPPASTGRPPNPSR